MKNIFRYLFVVTCLFSSINLLQAQWVQTWEWDSGLPSISEPVNTFIVSGTNIFAGKKGVVLFSTDKGASWTVGYLPLANTIGTVNVYSLAVSGSNLFAGTDGGVFLSTNNGTNWTAVNNGLTNTSVNSLVVSGYNLFGESENSGIFLSTNNGTSWSAVDSGLTNINRVFTLAVSGTNVFAGTNRGVFLSTNNGTSWTQVDSGLTPVGTTSYVNVNAFAVYGSNIFAGAYGGVYLSTNNGKNWAKVDSGLTSVGTNPYVNVNNLAVSGTNIFAGTSDGRVFITTNNGTNWIDESSGLTGQTITSIIACDTYLIIGVSYSIKNQSNQNIPASGIMRQPLSEMITSVKGGKGEIPTKISLSQNYPNPFNPSTNISFSIPSKSFVTLKVFDIIGRELATIVSEQLSEGTYSRQWNAAMMSSGIYFYRLQSGTYSETKKLILLK
jgi:photosystem II stability/assembly factor-like uncharacterized protein